MFNNYRSSQIDTKSIVFNLIAINVFVYIVCNIGAIRQMAPFGSPEFLLGMHYPTSEYFKPFQIITSMFTHMAYVPGEWQSLGHIAFNMFNVYTFGTVLERVWGRKRFLEFYFITGLGATLMMVIVQAVQIFYISGTVVPPTPLVAENPILFSIINSPSFGASGSVSGLWIAFAMLFADTEMLFMFIPIPIKAKYLIGGLMSYEVYAALFPQPNDHVAHFAHIGGALIGFIIIKIWNRNRNFLF